MSRLEDDDSHMPQWLVFANQANNPLVVRWVVRNIPRMAIQLFRTWTLLTSRRHVRALKPERQLSCGQAPFLQWRPAVRTQLAVLAAVRQGHDMLLVREWTTREDKGRPQ